MKVAGIDLSLSSTGIAIVDTNRVPAITVHRVESEPAKRPDGLKPSLQQRSARLARIADHVMILLGKCPPGGRGIDRLPELVLIEGPAYAAPQGAHEIGWNWGMVVDRLIRAGVLVAEATPGQVKQYATGSGSTSGSTKVTKPMVISAVRARYGDVGQAIRQNDEADALILAAMGCRYLGQPIEGSPLPATHVAPIKKIRWPERTLV